MVAKKLNVPQALGWSRVRAATTANGTLATAFENGDTIDGVVLATGDLILLKNQTTASENGVYKVAASGAPTRVAATDYTSSRGNVSNWATGADSAGQAVRVTSGTVNANKAFMQYAEPGVVGTNDLVFIARRLNGKAGL